MPLQDVSYGLIAHFRHIARIARAPRETRKMRTQSIAAQFDGVMERPKSASFWSPRCVWSA